MKRSAVALNGWRPGLAPDSTTSAFDLEMPQHGRAAGRPPRSGIMRTSAPG